MNHHRRYDPFDEQFGVATKEQPRHIPQREASLPPVVYQGVPTGQFTSPYVVAEGYPDNKVPVGTEIKLRAYYSAHCPGQPWYAPQWTVAVVAKGDGIACKNDTTHLTEGPVTGSPYLNSPSFPKMPDKPSVTLTVTLYGNPDAYQKYPL